METETSQRQRGVVGATCDARAAEKHPPQGAKSLKCASFAFRNVEILLYLGKTQFRGEDGPSPVFTRVLRANCSPSPALLPPRSRCHWTSVVTEPFRCQLLYRVRVPSVPASRSFVSLHHSLLVCACARLLSPLMISDLCSEQTHSLHRQGTGYVLRPRFRWPVSNLPVVSPSVPSVPPFSLKPHR